MKKNKEEIVIIGCLGSFIKLYNLPKDKRDKIWKQFEFKDTKKQVRIKVKGVTRFKENFYHPLDRRSNIMGIGFLDYLLAFFKKNKWEYDLQDFREWPKVFTAKELEKINYSQLIRDPQDPTKWAKIRYYQKEIIEACLLERNGIVEASTGSGKCFEAGTEILMYDGTVRNIEDIEVGDIVMGFDFTPRTVSSLATGEETMYEIIPEKGDSYVVNESHILSLRMTGNTKKISGYSQGEIVNISIKDYLKETKIFKQYAKGWRVPAKIEKEKVSARRIKKNGLIVNIEVRKKGFGKYYGFSLKEENKMFLLSDFTVVHNTVSFAALAKIIDLPTLILFEDSQLVHQTYKNFIKFGFDENKLGYIQGNNYKPGRITMSTIQSKHKLMDFLDVFKVIIVDECHSLKQQRFQELFMHSVAPYRFGFSATPWDPTDPSHFGKVVNYVGRIIYNKINTKDFIDQGFLAKDQFYFIDCDKGQGKQVIWNSSGKDYPALYKEEIVNNDYRNRLIAMICLKHKKEKIVIIYEHVTDNHGEKIKSIIEEYMPERKIKILQGNDSLTEREEAIKFFESGEDGIIIASRIFNKGVDIPSVNVGINAAAGKAYIASIQRAGRMLRTTKDKRSMIFYDFMDRNSRVFLRQSRLRFGTYQKKGHNVKKIKPIELKDIK